MRYSPGEGLGSLTFRLVSLGEMGERIVGRLKLTLRPCDFFHSTILKGETTSAFSEPDEVDSPLSSSEACLLGGEGTEVETDC
jgi:hypothetical protein